MFEPKVEPQLDEESEEAQKAGRKKALLVIGGVGLMMLVLVALLLQQTFKSRAIQGAGLDGAVRAGAVEFDSYRERLVFEEKEIIVHPNMIGMSQYEVRAKLTNRGDRAISGLELLGKIIDLQDRVVAQNISLPIPRLRTRALAVGETMRISVKVDAPAKVQEADVKDVTLDLTGLRFQ